MNRIATIVKGYPRLSETFIAQEILGLEKRGVAQLIVSLRHPTDGKVQDLQPRDRGGGALSAGISEGRSGARPRGRANGPRRSPAYPPRAQGVSTPISNATLRSTAGGGSARPACSRASCRADIDWLHTHYLHTPASVARYAALIRGHGLVVLRARQGHLDNAGMGASREARGRSMGRHLHARQSRLSALALRRRRARSDLVYHGLDFSRFPSATAAAGADARSIHASSRSGARWRRRAMPTCSARSRLLGGDRDWRFEHVGRRRACDAAEGAGEEARHRRRGSCGTGARTAPSSSRCSRRADLFVLPSRLAAIRRPRRPAERADGGAGLRRAGARDGRFRHSGARDAWQDGLACAASATRRHLRRRSRLLIRDRGFACGASAKGGAARVRKKFSSEPGIDFVASKAGARRASRREAA